MKKKENSDYKKREGVFEQVYEIVRAIPKGKVMTYGQIAKKIGTRDARKVGWALHANPSQETPCHRVVSKDGRVSKSFAFDGEDEQIRLLKFEGVGFVDEFHVDLAKHQLMS